MLWPSRCFRRLHYQQYFGTVASADKAINYHNVIVAVAKANELRARLLLQYTHEYEQYYEEQVNFFLFCYFYL